MTDLPALEAQGMAGVDLIRRTGAIAFTIRYQDDEKPIIWCASASYRDDKHEAAGALTPELAILRLCEQLLDGGQCQHCHKPTGFEPTAIDAMPLGQAVCWYQYDPELNTYRRGCEGS